MGFEKLINSVLKKLILGKKFMGSGNLIPPENVLLYINVSSLILIFSAITMNGFMRGRKKNKILIFESFILKMYSKSSAKTRLTKLS
ncbi:MAG TPA: hypothetical protein VIH13_00715 [Candidatus Hydromicrobium sp.]